MGFQTGRGDMSEISLLDYKYAPWKLLAAHGTPVHNNESLITLNVFSISWNKIWASIYWTERRHVFHFMVFEVKLRQHGPDMLQQLFQIPVETIAIKDKSQDTMAKAQEKKNHRVIKVKSHKVFQVL